jgi:hypothetical protein
MKYKSTSFTLGMKAGKVERETWMRVCCTSVGSRIVRKQDLSGFLFESGADVFPYRAGH